MKMNNKAVQKDDILCIMNGWARIGEVAMALDNHEGSACQQAVHISRCSQQEESEYLLDPYCLLYLLSKPVVPKQIHNLIYQNTH
jgi:hypothetical protein